MRALFYPSFLLLCILPGAAMAQALPSGIEQITTVEGISEYELDNGLGMLVSNLQNERTMAFHSELEAKVETLTADEVRAAMRRNLDLEALIIVKAGDFE